jgi:hypothetical protein
VKSAVKHFTTPGSREQLKTDRVVTGLAVADVARWRLDSSAGTELCDPQQVVGGADQVAGETGPLGPLLALAGQSAVNYTWDNPTA